MLDTLFELGDGELDLLDWAVSLGALMLLFFSLCLTVQATADALTRRLHWGWAALSWLMTVISVVALACAIST